jgi:hypothetical protein
MGRFATLDEGSMNTKRSKQSKANGPQAAARAGLAQKATTEQSSSTHNVFGWLVFGIFLVGIAVAFFVDESANVTRAELPYIENAKGPEAYRLLADGSPPDRSITLALAADGMVTIGGARHPIDRVGELLLSANRVPMDLVAVVVDANVSAEQTSQIVRVLTETGAAKTVTLKRAP